MIDVKNNFSGRMLVRLLITGVIVLFILLANLKFINELYIDRQLTPAGLVINGGIVAIFLLGLVKIVLSLLRYRHEERALARHVTNIERGQENLLKGVGGRTIIAQRYDTLKTLGSMNSKINHSALAATLRASEGTRISFARYVSNILILTGVFGTIVSLSIALTGASSLLQDIQGSDSMGMVIHGMSTALSTTITAILCYLFYGYFYLKLTDAQSHLLANIEGVTSVYLMPRFSHDKDSMLHEVAGLIDGLRDAATGMKEIQQEYAAVGSNLHKTVAALVKHSELTAGEILNIKQLLREGFRLPASGE
ncbi:MAG: MotA/TolQ/ExbB proton channel family protein [Gammaproteobacteria bacterium]|jgi:hypothetical protein